MQEEKCIIVRADSSETIGSGHTSRTIKLGKKLKIKGYRVVFVVIDLKGNINDLISNDFELIKIQESTIMEKIIKVNQLNGEQRVEYGDALTTIEALRENNIENIEWIIIDSYELNYVWQETVRKQLKSKENNFKILVIDDLSEKRQAPDILVNPCIIENENGLDYEGLLDVACKQLVGPMYAILGDEYKELSKARKERKIIKRILIYYGGGNNSSLLEETTLAIVEINSNVKGLTFDIVMGSNTSLSKRTLEILGQNKSINIHRQVSTLAALIYKADLAIGACGTTSIERLCLGLYSIVAITADNQIALAQTLSNNNLIDLIGKKHEITKNLIKDKMNKVLSRSKEYNLNMPKISDGYGVNRVINAMTGINGKVKLRKVRTSDKEILLAWSNELITRRNSFNRKLIPRNDHNIWFKQMMKCKNINMYILEDVEGTPIGQIRFDEENNYEYKVSLSVDYSARGYGMGRKILAIGLKQHKKDITYSCKYYAEIVAANERSLKLFMNEGFKIVSRTKKGILLSWCHR